MIETSLLVLWRHVELSVIASTAAVSSSSSASRATAANAASLIGTRSADELIVRTDAQLRRSLLTALRVSHNEPRAPTFALIAMLDGVGDAAAAKRAPDASPFAFSVARRLEELLSSNI